MADLLFLPYWPEKLVETARKTTLWENFAASFYGGIDEEIFMRLFGLSALAWVLSRIVPSSAGMPSSADLWSANIVIAILFGLGHLPALKNLLGRISPVMFARSLLLNAPVGLICGWLFWTYGIEAAIVAHFSADIVYHVLGTVVLRRKLSAH
jgi:membrane protease YdiL (CAAX protease family)